MEWEWPEEDKQLLQELQKKQSPDLGGKHTRQNDSGVDLDFISPEEYEDAFKRDMLASTALSHALRKIKAKTSHLAVPRVFRERRDGNSKHVGEKAAGNIRVAVQELNDPDKEEQLANGDKSLLDPMVSRTLFPNFVYQTITCFASTLVPLFLPSWPFNSPGTTACRLVLHLICQLDF
mmetsp:Transcript_35210/g.139894  ORF Transcript_35210/g.139894 Transcript_35210/m.139894 type:complete len:178 (-) Transcript_35210:4481-5014(-)